MQANYILSWSKDGGNLPSRAIDQNGVLVIPNLQEADAGSYTCTGSDPNSVDRATAVIRIEGEYTCTDSGPDSLDRATAIIYVEDEYTCTGSDPDSLNRATAVICGKGEWIWSVLTSVCRVSGQGNCCHKG